MLFLCSAYGVSFTFMTLLCMLCAITNYCQSLLFSAMNQHNWLGIKFSKFCGDSRDDFKALFAATDLALLYLSTAMVCYCPFSSDSTQLPVFLSFPFPNGLGVPPEEISN